MIDNPTTYSGTIEDKPYDTYANTMNGYPMATHFYFMDNTLKGDGDKCLKPFSQSGQVLNFLYMPFLDKGDLDLWKIEYDQNFYGTTSDDGEDPEKGVYVYKIKDTKVYDKSLQGKIFKYPKMSRYPEKHYANESKIYQYPYTYLTICDYINNPLQLIPRYLPALNNDAITVRVSQPISVTGGYTIYVPKYKNEYEFLKGADEGLFSAGGLDLPTSSTQYSQFMANSKNTFLAENASARRNENIAFGRGVINAGVGTANLGQGILNATNPFDIAKSIVSTEKNTTISDIANAVGQTAQGVTDMIQSNVDRKNRVEQSQAKIKDLMSAPRNVSLSSTDILMTVDRNSKQVWCNRYTITNYYKERLCDYWTLYGYKQNKLMYKENNGLIKSRKYFNYIKTVDANIKGIHLDKSELEMIKNIYNSGVTFWHYFELHQDGLEMYDYSKDNIEFTR